MHDVATGSVETLNEAEMDAYLASPTALAFWGRPRKLTQASLAAEIRISQPSVAWAEAGRNKLAVGSLAMAARALGVRMEDLLD